MSVLVFEFFIYIYLNIEQGLNFMANIIHGYLPINLKFSITCYAMVVPKINKFVLCAAILTLITYRRTLEDIQIMTKRQYRSQQKGTL